jgi:hypothetical protein
MKHKQKTAEELRAIPWKTDKQTGNYIHSFTFKTSKTDKEFTKYIKTLAKKGMLRLVDCEGNVYFMKKNEYEKEQRRING